MITEHWEADYAPDGAFSYSDANVLSIGGVVVLYGVGDDFDFARALAQQILDADDEPAS